MSDKTLGQVSYETFMRSRNPDAPEVKWVRWWPALSPNDRAHWEAAALAVVAETLKPFDGYEDADDAMILYNMIAQATGGKEI